MISCHDKPISSQSFVMKQNYFKLSNSENFKNDEIYSHGHTNPNYYLYDMRVWFRVPMSEENLI